jgi:hypothetical protein
MNTNYENENQNRYTTVQEDPTNWGFTVEKIIVHSEPTNSPHHYNSMNSSTDADVILQVIIDCLLILKHQSKFDKLLNYKRNSARKIGVHFV